MVESDLAGRYQLTAGEVAALTTRRFLTLLSGLPGDSRFADAWRNTPRIVDDPDEIARLTGR